MNYPACMSLVGPDPRSVPDERNWRAQEFIFILQMAILISMPKVPPTRRVYLLELRTAMRILYAHDM